MPAQAVLDSFAVKFNAVMGDLICSTVAFMTTAQQLNVSLSIANVSFYNRLKSMM